MSRSDLARTHGVGVVTMWTPDALQRKEEIVAELIREGYEGAALEAEALARAAEKGAKPYDMAKSENTFVNGGTNIMLLAVTGAVPVYYTNALAAIGVGDSAAAFALTQTNLQGAVVTTDRIRKGMNATFPSVALNVATFQATFATSEANFVWNEWCITNAVADATGTMLNRAVANLGTKTSAVAWQLTATITQT
jgi:plasmid stabilization system protein ParE